MVEQLVFRKKACGNLITNIANVLNKFVKENDEVQVEERLAADKVKRIENIKEAVKEEEAAAELAEKNILITQIAMFNRDKALKDAEEAKANLEAFLSLPSTLQKMLQLKL